MSGLIQWNLNGKVALVTGSAKGIGKSIACMMADSGAKVMVSDINQELGESSAAEIGGTFVPCDISDIAQVESAVKSVVERFGRLDIMVNNAGINSSRPEDRVSIADYPIDTWLKIIGVDLTGTFYCCRTAAKQMLTQRSGSIINIASVAGTVALQLQSAFVASKAAVIRLTESMACELGTKGIRVNTVSPGSTLTDATRSLFYGEDGSFRDFAEQMITFIPMRRPGESDEIASAVCFLASDAASYVNGHNIVVDGGWTSGFSRNF